MDCLWVIFAGAFTLLAHTGRGQDVTGSRKSAQISPTCRPVYSTEPCPQNVCSCPPCPACVCQCYRDNVTSPATAPQQPTQGVCTQDGTGSASFAAGCDVLYKSGVRRNGVYTIDPDGGGRIEVYCDMESDGGGWTVFQKRQDGSVDFYRDWDAYRRGFGDPREFWIGLEHIHRLTKARPTDLRVTLADSGGTEKFARYRGFRVEDEGANYTLRLGLYLEGSAGDSLEYHRDMAFSTKDRDNDRSAANCAEDAKGAWWFNDCHTSNLNGAYHGGPSQSVNWYSFSGDNVPLARAEMRLRPSDF
ncbi:cell surface pattern recognition receptor signaling pathway [Branchiostoma belcheri]|nr:cell surface pattern recognition receptor signaling pathway [Branchiostoma belcheri]